MTEGWHGWDDYAAFYDWENARTFGRRDVAFWRRFVRDAAPPALELGCGTGRLLVPMARTGMAITGIDRSAPMLDLAARRVGRLPRARRPPLVRGDIRALPFRRATFGVAIAAYGLVQSLLNDADLAAVLSEIGRVLRPGGVVGLDLVPDLVAWKEYTRKVTFRGRSSRGGQITLTETVRQQPRRGVTTFDEEFVERLGRKVVRRQFSLSFRTVGVDEMADRLAHAGLRVESRFGDYRGGPWAPQSEAWLMLARRV